MVSKLSMTLPRKIGLYILFAVSALVMIGPLLWIVVISLKTTSAVFGKPFALPEWGNFQWKNYIEAAETIRLFKTYWTTFLMTVEKMAISILVAILASFALSRFEYKLRTAVYTFLIFGMVISVFSNIFPIYVLTVKFHLLGSLLGAVLPNVAFTLPTAILIMCGSFKTVPKDLDEAVMIDGGGMLTVLFRILVPVSKPAIATMGILAFLGSWNDYALPFIILDTSSNLTLQVSLTFFKGLYSVEYAEMAAGVVLAVLPIIVIYVFLQRYIMEGMLAGAIKG